MQVDDAVALGVERCAGDAGDCFFDRGAQALGIELGELGAQYAREDVDGLDTDGVAPHGPSISAEASEQHLAATAIYRRAPSRYASGVVHRRAPSRYASGVLHRRAPSRYASGVWPVHLR